MKIKNAFTLAELSLVFIVIGIIAAIGLNTTKPFEKAYKYAYTRMYNALSLSIYNYMINNDGSFPSTENDFCAALLKYINTSDNAASCSGSSLGANPTEFSDSKVRIRASNGVKLWIGAGPYSYTQTFDSSPDDTVKYYIVYVDLNGDRGPNTAEWKKTRMSDIVAFIVTDRFKVIPIGYPEVDTRYMAAHVVYPSQNNYYTTEEEDVLSAPMSYYEAKMNAYGDRVVPGDLETYDFRSTLPDNSYFKVDDYSKYYTTAPEFDEDNCDFDDEDVSDDDDVKEYAVCGVKIYDYH